MIDLTERNDAHVKSLIADQEILKAKYVGLEEKGITRETSFILKAKYVGLEEKGITKETSFILKAKYVGLEEKGITRDSSFLRLVSEKDKLIASQLKQIEETRKDNKDLRKAMDEKDDGTLSMEYNELKKEYDELVKAKAQSDDQEKLVIKYEQVINEKDEELASLNEVLEELRKSQGSKPTKLTRPDATGESFRTKPRGGSARNIDINNYKCENPRL